MISFVKRPAELDTDLDKWLYLLKHLTEFPERPKYLSGSEFDPLFDLAEYANLNEEERNMYNQSLKHKWDNENAMDYAIETAVEEERAKAEKEKAELKAKAEQEKKEIAIQMARKMLTAKEPLRKITEYTGLSIQEIEGL
jgi:hypothetical protein